MKKATLISTHLKFLRKPKKTFASQIKLILAVNFGQCFYNKTKSWRIVGKQSKKIIDLL